MKDTITGNSRLQSPIDRKCAQQKNFCTEMAEKGRGEVAFSGKEWYSISIGKQLIQSAHICNTVYRRKENDL